MRVSVLPLHTPGSDAPRGAACQSCCQCRLRSPGHFLRAGATTAPPLPFLALLLGHRGTLLPQLCFKAARIPRATRRPMSQLHIPGGSSIPTHMTRARRSTWGAPSPLPSTPAHPLPPALAPPQAPGMSLGTEERGLVLEGHQPLLRAGPGQTEQFPP